MGERKVLNKYIPADFDPKLVPRSKKPKDNLVPVRMMLPFSIQCSTCSTFMYRGRKFNSKKELMAGPDGKYLTIQRYRFYIKCTHCSRPITFSTDPKNADYEMENGATRNYEIWHDKEKSTDDQIQEEEFEEAIDPMKALENRVLDSQREMADLDNLDEIKAMNKKHLQMLASRNNNDSTYNQVSDILSVRNSYTKQEATDSSSITAALNEYGLTNEEEALVQSFKFQRKKITKKRLTNKDEEKLDMKRQKTIQDATSVVVPDEEQQYSTNNTTKTILKPLMPVITIKKRTKITVLPKKENVVAKKNSNNSGGEDDVSGIGGLLGAYASSDSEV